MKPDKLVEIFSRKFDLLRRAEEQGDPKAGPAIKALVELAQQIDKELANDPEYQNRSFIADVGIY